MKVGTLDRAGHSDFWPLVGWFRFGLGVLLSLEHMLFRTSAGLFPLAVHPASPLLFLPPPPSEAFDLTSMPALTSAAAAAAPASPVGLLASVQLGKAHFPACPTALSPEPSTPPGAHKSV